MSEQILISNLGKPKKQVAAKILRDDARWTFEKIARVLNVSEPTAFRYAERFAGIETPDELKEFETKFKLYIKGKEFVALDMVFDRMLEIIPREKRLDQLVRAGEFLQGKRDTNQTNVQVNNFIPLLDVNTDVRENDSNEQDKPTNE